MMCPPTSGCAPAAGWSSNSWVLQTSEQVDWQVTITRVVHRRLRYRRRCECPGHRTVIAPPAPNPIPKGRFTPSFLARLL
jgi:transposase